MASQQQQQSQQPPAVSFISDFHHHETNKRLQILQHQKYGGPWDEGTRDKIWKAAAKTRAIVAIDESIKKRILAGHETFVMAALHSNKNPAGSISSHFFRWLVDRRLWLYEGKSARAILTRL